MTATSIALVTGANKGIGFAIAAGLARQGVTVLLGARDQERRARAVETLKADGLNVHPIALDVTDPGEISAAADHIEEHFGRLDILVNNAATSKGLHHAPSEADMVAVEKVFATNVFGPIRVINAMLPLIRRSEAGRIINVSSEAGSVTAMADTDGPLYQLPANIDYPTSKAALNSLTVEYAKELRADGIKVNAVTPAASGMCATDWTKDLGFPISRTAADGAAVVIALANGAFDDPTGSFLGDDGPLPW